MLTQVTLAWIILQLSKLQIYFLVWFSGIFQEQLEFFYSTLDMLLSE
jgi:hypothetical protein